MDMDKKDMLERVAKAARRAYMKGFAAGSGGNVSIRIQGQVYISPSGSCLGDLTAEDMIMLEADGFVPPAGGPDYGGRRPSKEAGMHLACYRSRPDILCLFHLHSPYSIAVACRRQEVRPWGCLPTLRDTPCVWEGFPWFPITVREAGNWLRLSPG